jgi:hypothetical protein
LYRKLLIFSFISFSVLKKKAEILKDVDVVDVEQGLKRQPFKQTLLVSITTEPAILHDLRGFDRLTTSKQRKDIPQILCSKLESKL